MEHDYPLTSIARLTPYANLVTVYGTVDSIALDHQQSEPVAHLNLSDGTAFKPIRAVLDCKLPQALRKSAKICAKGQWTSEGHVDSHFLRVSHIREMGNTDPLSDPLQDGSADRKTYPHLFMRTPWRAVLLRFRSAVMSALVQYFDDAPGGPFYQVHHPVLTHTDCEGGAEVFPVLTQKSKNAAALQGEDFFGGRRYLTVTAAIHGEAFAMSLDRVWMLAPCFRAERVQDKEHLAEFHMLEMALNNIESLDTLLVLCEKSLQGVVRRLKESTAGQEVLSRAGTPETTSVSREQLAIRWNMILKPNWPRITHAEAVKLMQEAERTGAASFNVSPAPETDFSREHELYLLDHFQRPMFVTHFPTKIRLFSALQSPPPTESGALQTTESLDVLLPGIGEVASGGLREHRLETLIDVMRTKGFFKQCEAKRSQTGNNDFPYLRPDESLDSLEWFADLRRWGSTPHGGVGFGFERLLVFLTGAESVQDVVGFPRSFQSCVA